MKNILLINPPIYYLEGEPYTLDGENPPLGLLYIASYIKKHSSNYHVKVVDVEPNKITKTKLKQLIESFKPWVVGIAAMTLQLQGAVEIAKLIKEEIDPRIITFMGGNHISGDPEFIERNPHWFDYAITGEGEKTFFESLEKLSAGETIPRIQQGEIITQMDTLPFPDRNQINPSHYTRPYYYVVSRGCPFSCSFCSSPAVSKQARYRSADSVIKEIKESLDKSRGFISFQDDTFTANQEFVYDFCRQVKEEGLNLKWNCSTRIDLVDDKLIKTMKDAGCSDINFGIESGSERVRRETMGKGRFSNEQILESINLCASYDIRANGFFILGNPTETPEEMRQTKDLILASKLAGIALSMLTPFPGSPLYERAKENGVINEAVIDSFAKKESGTGCAGVYPLYSEHLEKGIVQKAMKDIFMKFYLRPSAAFTILKRDLSYPKIFMEDLKSAFYLLFKGGSRRRPFVE